MTWVCEVHGAGGRSWVGMVLHAARVALTEGATCRSRRKVSDVNGMDVMRGFR